MKQLGMQKSDGKHRYWKKQIQSWRESGLTQSEFCRRHRLKVHQMVYWRKKINEPESSVQFVSLDLERFVDHETASGTTPIRLNVGNGFCVEVDKGFDPATLKQLIVTLRQIR